MARKKYTYIDLFAGCGGLSEGFLSTGRYEALAHVEWEKPMVDTLRHRLVQEWGQSPEDAFKHVIQFDIQRTEELLNGNWTEDSIKTYGAYNHKDIVSNGLKGLIKNRKVDFVIGGPPCQAYSIHGRATDKDSMQNDYRNFLFESFCNVVDCFKPEGTNTGAEGTVSLGSEPSEDVYEMERQRNAVHFWRGSASCLFPLRGIQGANILYRGGLALDSLSGTQRRIRSHSRCRPARRA